MAITLTISGQMLDLSEPRAADIRLGDIARGLCQPRFNGQAWTVGRAATLGLGDNPPSRPWTILDHSLLVHEIVRVREHPAPARLLHFALLHDAHEAYTGDVSTPLMRSLSADAQGELREIQRDIDRAVRKKLNLPDPTAREEDIIASADETALALERNFFLPDHSRWQIGSVSLYDYRRHLLFPPDLPDQIHAYVKHFST